MRMTCAESVISGDFVEVSEDGSRENTDLLRVTAIAWTPEGFIKLFGWMLMAGREASLPPLSPMSEIHVWEREGF